MRRFLISSRDIRPGGEMPKVQLSAFKNRLEHL